MAPTSPFSPEELALISDQTFFRAKAGVMKKVRALLEALHQAYQEELAGATLLSPPEFDLGRHQFVKGEHLEEFPYQYLDFPKHFVGDDKCTFRSLFWWGHAFIFALILEGAGLAEYKRNFLTRYQDVAGRQLVLCLSPSLWEWKHGAGYTLPVTPGRRSEIAAVLSGRTSFKVARFVPPSDRDAQPDQLIRLGRETLRAVLPIISP